MYTIQTVSWMEEEEKTGVNEGERGRKANDNGDKEGRRMEGSGAACPLPPPHWLRP